MKTIAGIKIAGHEYSVVIDDQNKIVRTACRGRWAMSACQTGSEWLDKQLQSAINELVVEHVAYTVEKFLDLATEIDSLNDEHETLMYSPIHYFSPDGKLLASKSDTGRKAKLDTNVVSRDKLEAKFAKMWHSLTGKQQLVVYGQLERRGLGYVADDCE